MTNKLLFLCTGNYYRSRFAETLFNWLATEAELQWKADSRGLAMELGIHNVGPMSKYSIEGLRARNITVSENLRFPTQLTEQDLSAADLVIALYEAEHRPLLAERFPDWTERVDYWQVPDLGLLPAKQALLEIEQRVHALIEQLRTA